MFRGQYDVEKTLRSLVFQNYSKINRPILNFSEVIKLKYGIEIKVLNIYQKLKILNLTYGLYKLGKMNI